MGAYILNEPKMFSDIADGIAIVINSETGIYYGMNNFGTIIFENLMRGASPESILAAIVAIPDAPEDMEKYLSNFVQRLVNFAVIREDDSENKTSSVIDAAIAVKDNFIPKIEEYSDAQELLLADPIHEVKEDIGWQPNKFALETDLNIVIDKEKKME